MIVKQVYNNVSNKLEIPKEMLPECGIPHSHHFQGTPLDNLVELAGRVCYDSARGKKTRSSEAYHKHIIEVKHLSVQEHANITVQFDTKHLNYNDNDTIAIATTTINRPGVYLLSDGSGNLQITANLRAIREWNYFHNNMAPYDMQDQIGNIMKLWARCETPKVMFDYAFKPDEFCFVPNQLIKPINDEQKWISFYFGEVSRGFSHELVRHKWHTAVSQRSTRYVDESESDWAWHPLLRKYEDEIIRYVQK